MSKFVKNHLLMIVLVSTGILFFMFVLPFLSWILLAGVIAIALKPLQKDLFVKRLKMSRGFSVYALLGLIIIILIPFVFSFVSLFGNIKEQVSHIQASSSITSVEMILEKAYDRITPLQDILPEEKAVEFTKKGIEKGAGQVVSIVSQGVKNIPGALLALFFFTASLFYFIVDAKKIKEILCSLSFVDRKELDKLIQIVKTSSQSTLFAAVLTGFAQATLVALPAKILGFHYFISTFFITFFLSQIPLIGIVPAWIFICGYFYLQDNIPAVIIMMIASGVAGISDNVVRIWFLSQYDSLHPLAGFFAALGGLVIFGPLGVIIGPVVTMIFFKLAKTELLTPKDTPADSPKTEV